MMIFVSDISLIKFLPDCRETSFVSYIEELSEIMDNECGQTNDRNLINFPIFIPSLKKKEVYAKYDTYLRSVTAPTLSKRKLGKQGIYLMDTSFDPGFSIFMENAETLETEWIIKVTLTKIPTIVISSEPRLYSEEFRCKNFQRKALERELERVLAKGVTDIIKLNGIYLESNDLEKETLLGKPTWIYLEQKIIQIKALHQRYTQEKSQGEPSLVYEFAKQSSVVFSLIGDPYVKLKLPDLWSVFNLEQKTMEYLSTAQNQVMGEFLTKCDQILLEAWGNEKFSEMLEPLNVSLDEWLKAGKD